MDIASKLCARLCDHNFRAADKQDALRKIAELAVRADVAPDALTSDAVFNALVEREAAVSTGIGNGIAIPHARLDGLQDFLFFVLAAPKGISFESLDNKKVQVFFVVLAPMDKPAEHLKLLAGISQALNRSHLKKEILKAANSEVLHEIVCRYLDTDTERKPMAQVRQKLLIIVLYYEDDLQNILEYLLDQNIEGATIMRSEGMGVYISSLPLFAGFLGFMREDRNHSHTLFAIIPEDRERQIVSGIEQITGDLDKKRGAMMMCLDIAWSKGTMSMI